MTGRERFRVGQWYDVPTRQGRRRSNQEGDRHHVKITKVFVSNLPPRCSSADLIQVLKGYGDIQGTYIARKYDKLGKRFGFVSFVNVNDPVSLENELKDVWIGSYKLFIVLARFVDDSKVNGKAEKVWRPVQEKTVEKNDFVDPDPKVTVEKAGPSNTGGRTFKDTLLDIEPTPEIMKISVPEDVVCCSKWYDCGLLGRLLDFHSLTNLRNWFSASINKNVSFKYLGGLNVIVVFESVEDKLWFFEKKNLWELVFKSLEEWEGQIIEFERIAWIKVYGIPLCLLVESVVKDIGASIGEVVQCSSVEDGDDLSYVLMGVLCKSVCRIRNYVQLSWKANVFPLVIEEDPGDWVPDCLIDYDEEDQIEDVSAEKIDGDDVCMTDDEVNNVIDENNDGEEVWDGAELEVQSQHSSLSPNNGNDGIKRGEEVSIPEKNSNDVAVGNCEENIRKVKKSKGFRKKSRKKQSVLLWAMTGPKRGPEGVKTYLI
ncbi:putative RNA recognition motif domain, nucleotide-binding alpha-beta plait domain superfamily [Helianthus annuus]|nr:putative RNA recognition motif domain, nucleotide-binding alpha-beta plait domain superfamily [Helianthus annuus]